MVTVYIWGALDLTGHSSLKTTSHYFSFHPTDRKNAKTVTGSPPTIKEYNEDCDANGRPTDSISINWLDERAIDVRMLKIAEQMDRHEIRYTLFGMNCSRVVADLLFVGAGQRFDSLKTIRMLFDEVKRAPFRHDHGRVAELIRESIEDGVALICARRGPLGPLAKTLASILVATDFTTREFCWTPGDVKCLALDLSRKNLPPMRS